MRHGHWLLMLLNTSRYVKGSLLFAIVANTERSFTSIYPLNGEIDSRSSKFWRPTPYHALLFTVILCSVYCSIDRHRGLYAVQERRAPWLMLHESCNMRLKENYRHRPAALKKRNKPIMGKPARAAVSTTIDNHHSRLTIPQRYHRTGDLQVPHLFHSVGSLWTIAAISLRIYHTVHTVRKSCTMIVEVLYVRRHEIAMYENSKTIITIKMMWVGY